MSDSAGRIKLLARYATEFLVIFLGVWLSLLAEGWRQGRDDRAAERAALKGLVRDLEVDLGDMAGNLARASRAFDASKALLESRSVSVHSPDSVAMALTEIGPCSFPQWNTSQYSTLKSSGDLNLIQDESLRSMIAEYYEALSGLDWLHDVDCAESRAVFDLLAPLVTLGVPSGEVRPGRTEEFSAEVVAVAEPRLVFSDPALMDRIAKLASHRRFLIHWIEREVGRAEALRDALRAGVEGG